MKVVYIAIAVSIALSVVGIATTFAIEQHRVILKTEIPEKPAKVNLYIQKGEERDFYISDDLMKPKENLPSNGTALKIAEEFLTKRSLPGDAKLVMIERVELKGLNVKTGEVTAQKPLFVSIKYKRILNGSPVVGPGDEIEVAVAKDVLYFSKKWKILERVAEVNVIPAAEALKKLEKGEILNKPMGLAYPVTIHRIEFGYYSGEKEFYPAWIFYCKDSAGNDLKLAVKAI